MGRPVLLLYAELGRQAAVRRAPWRYSLLYLLPLVPVLGGGDCSHPLSRAAVSGRSPATLRDCVFF